MRKYFNYLLAISVIAMGFNACLPTNPPENSKNADITFRVRSATKTSIPNVDFTKDVVANGKDTLYVLVSNKDSLPYLTNPDSLIPIISGNSLSSIEITMKKAGKDTTFNFDASKPDTISFRDTVKIVTTAQDKKTTKTFKVVVNIHQNDPELYTWIPRQKIYSENATAEKLVVIDSAQFLYLKVGGVVKAYVCEDETNWSPKTLTGFPNSFDIKYIFQTDEKLFIAQGDKIYSSEDGLDWEETTADAGSESIDNLLFTFNNKIFGITKTDAKLYKFAGNKWEFALDLPDGFPVNYAAICVTNAVSGAPRVFFVGGEDKDGNLTSAVFATDNGTYFANLGSTGHWFSPRKDVCVIQYDTNVLMIGGQDNALIISNFFYVSDNFGLSWREPFPNMISNENIFVPRINMQAALNKEKTKIYFVGGQYGVGTWAKDAWVVMKNSVLWETLNQ